MAWAPDYITVGDLKGYERIDDTVDDAELALYVTAASGAINDHTNRQFGKVDAPEQRRYSAWFDYERGRWVVDIDDLQTTTGLVLEIDGTALTMYDLEPINALQEGKAWTRLAVSPDSAVQPTGEPYEVYGTATWGWTSVPSAVKMATRLQASRFAIRRESPYGVAGSPELGSELRLLSKLDPDVAVSLRGLPRSRAVG